MQITTTDLTAKIEYGNDTFTHPLNTVSYVINKEFDGITLFRSNEAIGSSPFDQTTVNGQTLTAQNADALLASLFGYCSGGGSGSQVQTNYLEENATSPAYLQNRPLSKIQTGEDFPQPVVSGHVCEIYDTQGNLKFVYEWDGFIWIMTAADYNLIFDAYVNNNYDSLPNFKKKIDNTYYFYIKPGEEFASTIYTENFHKISGEYPINSINYEVTKDYDSLSFEDINVRYFTLSRNYNLSPVTINKFEIKDSICPDIHVSSPETTKIKDFHVEGLRTESEDTSGHVYAYASNSVTLINNRSGQRGYYANLTQPEGSSVQPSVVRFENNKFLDMFGHLNINGGEMLVTECDATILNNEQALGLSIDNLNQLKSLNINFDPDFQYLSIYSSVLSTQALDSLITALTTTTFNQTVQFSYGNSQPALSQAQLDALAANNVDVQVS